MNFLTRALCAATLLGAPTAFAGLLPSGSFEILTQDDSGGGWVINHIPGAGDRLWGCKDVKVAEGCTQLHFNDWTAGTGMEFIHITDTSMKGWFVLKVPLKGHFLFACSDPEGTPKCDPVNLDLLPPMPGLARVFPDYDCQEGCSVPAKGGGGGLSIGGGGGETKNVIEGAAKGDMWLEASLKLPGPVNLYSCTGLESSPVCKLVLPDFLVIDREKLGFKKYEEIYVEDADKNRTYGPGVRIADIDEGSAAEEAKLRPGDVIVKVGEFEVNRQGHLKQLFSQYPAGFPIEVTLDDGRKVELKAKRKEKKK